MPIFCLQKDLRPRSTRARAKYIYRSSRENYYHRSSRIAGGKRNGFLSVAIIDSDVYHTCLTTCRESLFFSGTNCSDVINRKFNRSIDRSIDRSRERERERERETQIETTRKEKYSNKGRNYFFALDSRSNLKSTTISPAEFIEIPGAHPVRSGLPGKNDKLQRDL